MPDTVKTAVHIVGMTESRRKGCGGDRKGDGISGWCAIDLPSANTRRARRERVVIIMIVARRPTHHTCPSDAEAKLA